MRKIVFVNKKRASDSDATVFLQDEKNLVLAEISVHQFESGQIQLAINFYEKMSIVTAADKPFAMHLTQNE